MSPYLEKHPYTMVLNNYHIHVPLYLHGTPKYCKQYNGIQEKHGSKMVF